LDEGPNEFLSIGFEDSVDFIQKVVNALRGG
jgi:hypothetical protein